MVDINSFSNSTCIKNYMEVAKYEHAQNFINHSFQRFPIKFPVILILFSYHYLSFPYCSYSFIASAIDIQSNVDLTRIFV